MFIGVTMQRTIFSSATTLKTCQTKFLVAILPAASISFLLFHGRRTRRILNIGIIRSWTRGFGRGRCRYCRSFWHSAGFYCWQCDIDLFGGWRRGFIAGRRWTRRCWRIESRKWLSSAGIERTIDLITVAFRTHAFELRWAVESAVICTETRVGCSLFFHWEKKALNNVEIGDVKWITKNEGECFDRPLL